MAVKREGSRRKKEVAQTYSPPQRKRTSVPRRAPSYRTPARPPRSTYRPTPDRPSPSGKRANQAAQAKRAAQQSITDKQARDTARRQLRRQYERHSRETRRVERLMREQGKGPALLRKPPTRRLTGAERRVSRDVARVLKGPPKEAGAAARRLDKLGAIKLPSKGPKYVKDLTLRKPYVGTKPGGERIDVPFQERYVEGSKRGRGSKIDLGKVYETLVKDFSPVKYAEAGYKGLEGAGKQFVKTHTSPTKASSLATGEVAGKALKALGDVAEETYQHPGRTAGATVKSVPPLLAGIIPGTYAAIKDPEKAWEAVKDDFAERYAGGETTKKAVRKYGLIPYGLDLAGVGAASGRLSGVAARAQGSKTSLGRFATKPRPRLRLAPGVTREQDISPNLIIAAMQRLEDKGRARRFRRQMQGDKPLRGQLPRNKDGDFDLEGLEEVVHSPQGGKLSRKSRALLKLENRRHGRDVVQYRHELGRELADMRKAINKLNRKERKGFAIVVEQGLPLDRRTGINHLRDLSNLILEERAALAGGKLEDFKLPRGSADELKLIDDMIKDYTSYVTPNSIKQADRMVQWLRASGKDDPGFAEVTGQIRAAGPQALTLGEDVQPQDILQLQARRREQTLSETIAEAEDRLDQARAHLEARRQEVQSDVPPDVARRVEELEAEQQRIMKPWENVDDPLDEQQLPTDQHPAWSEAIHRAADIDNEITALLRPYQVNPSLDPEVQALYDAMIHAQDDLDNARQARMTEGMGNDRVEAEKVYERMTDVEDEIHQLEAELGEIQQENTPEFLEQVADELGIDDPDLLDEAIMRNEALEGEVIERIVELSKELDDLRAINDSVLATERALGVEDLRFQGMEESGDIIRRLNEAREGAGLREPGYFPHEGALLDRSAGTVYTRGLAQRAMGDPQATKYARFRQGRVNRDPHMFEIGLARNVKRRFNWDRVSETMDMYALVRDKTLAQLHRYIKENELDPRDWVAVNPGKFREQEKFINDTADFDDFGGGKIEDAYRGARREVKSLDELASDPAEYRGSRGWALIPKEIDDNIMKSRSQIGEGVVARAAGKYIKGLPSKLILGTNPSWLVLQFINDAYLGALAGIGPQHLARSEAFWRRNPQAKERLTGHIGGGAFERELRGSRLGASVQGDLAGMWRGLKQTRLLQYTGRNNPLDAFIKVDKRKAQVVRRAVLHKKIQKEAWRRMGENASGFGRVLDQLGVDAWGRKAPDDIMEQVTKDAEFMERAAEHVNKMMGDYTTFAPVERRFLERNIMFYSFLRFSLRFSFMTMPRNHPIIAALQTTLSRLHEEEVRRLLGADEDDPLPPGVLASFYFKDDGVLKEVTLGRLNPTLNVLTGASGPNQLIGMLPPLWNALANQMANENIYFRDPWLVEGENQERETSRNPAKYGLENRARIGAKDVFLSPLSPLRTLNEIREGRVPQGADSLPFDERPTVYWDPQISTDIEMQKRKDLARDPRDVALRRNVLPFLAEESYDRPRTQRYLERLGERRPTAERKEDQLFRKIEGSRDYEELFYLYEERADLHRELSEAKRERDPVWAREVQRDINGVERRIKRYGR